MGGVVGVGGGVSSPQGGGQSKEDLHKSERLKALQDVQSFLNPLNKPPAKTLLKQHSSSGSEAAATAAAVEGNGGAKGKSKEDKR